MAKYLVKGEKLTAIADAVRNKVGTTASLSLDAMAVQINNLVIKTTTTINVVPDTTSSFTYDGSVKTPVWRNYDSEQLAISGQTSATNAGTYKVYFTPKADFEWWDGTTTAKEVQWSITKATGTMSLSATSGTISGKNSPTTGAINTVSFTVNRNGDGAISVVSSNSSIATAKVSGNIVTVSAAGYGSATITVSVAASTNYTAPSNKTYSITINYRYSTIVPNTGATWTSNATSVNKTSSSTTLTHALKSTADGTRAVSNSYTNIDTTGYNTLHVICSHSVNNTSGSDQNWFLSLENATGSSTVTNICHRGITKKTNHANQSYEKIIDISGLSGIYRINSYCETWSTISVNHNVTITTCRMY